MNYNDKANINHTHNDIVNDISNIEKEIEKMSSPIKSIQRGVKSITGITNVSTTIDINTINPDKSFVILNMQYGGNYNCSIRLDKLNSNSFTTISTFANSNGGTFSWQVIEFV